MVAAKATTPPVLVSTDANVLAVALLDDGPDGDDDREASSCTDARPGETGLITPAETMHQTDAWVETVRCP